MSFLALNARTSRLFIRHCVYAVHQLVRNRSPAIRLPGRRPVQRRGSDMRAAPCLILLFCPAIGWADDTKAPGSKAVREADDRKATVGGIQGGKPLKFGDNLGTYYEGLV